MKLTNDQRASLVGALAINAHQSWAGWMAYMFSKCTPNEDGSRTIPKESVDRWERQLATPFEGLPLPERDSDYVEANLRMDIIEQHLADV